MKVEVRNEETFKPVTINITLEKEEELLVLSALVNASVDSMHDHQFADRKLTKEEIKRNDVGQALYNTVSLILKEHGLAK